MPQRTSATSKKSAKNPIILAKRAIVSVKGNAALQRILVSPASSLITPEVKPVLRAAAPKRKQLLAVAATAGGEDFSRIYKIPARGNLGGGQRFELRRKGRKVQKLELWSEVDRLRGVRATFEDGAVMQAGTLGGQGNTSISFHADESITSSIISSAAYKAGRAGSVELQTDFGQKFLGVYPSITTPVFKFNNFTPYTDLTKGSLIGVYGGAGADLDHIGLILALPEDTQYEYYNVRYDLSSFKAVGERMLSLKEGIIKNPSSSATVSEQMSFSHAYTATKTWSNSVGLKVGVKTSFKAGVPILAEGKVEVSVEASYSYTWGESVADQKTDSWVVTVTAPPKTRVRVKGVVTESTIDVPYSADLVVRLSDGTSKTINNISGVYRGVNVSRFTVDTEDIPL